MSQLLIVYSPDAENDAARLVSLLSTANFTSTLVPDTLLVGPIDISRMVSDSLAVIIILSPGLATDTLCLTIAKHAMSVGKGICVTLSGNFQPSWSMRPFDLMDGDMFDINWGLFAVRLRTAQRISEVLRSD